MIPALLSVCPDFFRRRASPLSIPAPGQGNSNPSSADEQPDLVQGYAGPTDLQLLGHRGDPGDFLLEPAAGAVIAKIEAMPGVCVYGTAPATGKCSANRGVPYSPFVERLP